MTTPHGRRKQPSGQRRYYTAQQAAAAVTAVIIQAELAMLAALASYVLAAATGALLANIAARRLRGALLMIVASAETALRDILASLTASVRADVQEVIAEDLGPLARLLGVVPSPSAGKLSASLHTALLNALNDVFAAFGDITRTGRDPLEIQEMLDALASQGLRGITDKAGRRWDLSAYAEMAARTAAERMHLAMQVRALSEAGLDLVQVHRSSPSPPCPKCVPWQHRVLSLSGRTPGFPTLAQAMAAGLLHPMCRDSIAPFRGSVPPPAPTPAQEAAMADRYARERTARERQRQQREAQRLAEVALSPLAKARARRLARSLTSRR